jgi:hypothetical protein
MVKWSMGYDELARAGHAQNGQEKPLTLIFSPKGRGDGKVGRTDGRFRD